MPIFALLPEVSPHRTTGLGCIVGRLLRPQWLLLLLFSELPCLAVTSIRDEVRSPLDPRKGRVEIAYTVEAGTNDAPARLAGVVLDSVTGRSLGPATLLGCPTGMLTPGRHHVVWNVLADAAFRPLNRVELRLFAEPILSGKEEEGEDKAGKTLPRLLFHCSLDSADAIAACGGTVTAAEFVEGVHGKAVQVGHTRDPICFPLENVITDFRKGSVEIWAKILEPDYILSNSASELNLVNLRQVNDDIGNFFRITLTTNNGHGQSGLVGGISIHDKASTHIGRIGPFDIAAAIGGNNPTEWHHYRLSWDADGIGGGNDRTAVFVDNRKVVSSTEPLFDIKPAWDHFRYILKISESNGVQPWAVFDELKLWDGAVVPENRGQRRDDGLLLRCPMDSMDDVRSCAGSAGQVSFVSGHSGQAMHIKGGDPLAFPLNGTISDLGRGCVDFWARIPDAGRMELLPEAELNLARLRRVGERDNIYFRAVYTVNDGQGHGGLVGQMADNVIASTQSFGTFSADTIVGGSASDWHRYTVSWDARGIAGTSDTLAVYVDGRKVAATQDVPNMQEDWNRKDYVLSVGETRDDQVSVEIDELRYWDHAIVPEPLEPGVASTTQPKPADTGKPIYLVIDLSGGPAADKYPYEIREGVPDGGWTDEYKTTKLVLRYIEPGEFLMGSPQGEFGRDNNETSHLVRLTKPFFIGVFEVTQKQWELVMGKNPAHFPGEKRPVEQVSYGMIRGTEVGVQWPRNKGVDSMSFLGLLRIKTGLDSLDIPTEAQWEYACRAGTQTSLNNGTSVRRVDSDPNMLRLGRCSSNWQDGHGDYNQAHTTVGSYEPNAWGLYDMHGNVWEWCRDWYVEQYPIGASQDPVGPQTGNCRPQRGGCWANGADLARSAVRNRGQSGPASTSPYAGIRLVFESDATLGKLP